MRAARIVFLALSLLIGLAVGPSAHAAHVNVIVLDDQIISPVTQQYILEAIDRSEQDQSECLVVILDTPGGLLQSTRAIVKGIMNADVPVVVYVGPSGARAGSAGVFITLASHIAAMAPSTNIGAAHPVAVGGGGSPVKKLIRRITRSTKGDSKKGETEEIIEEEEQDPMTEKIVNDTVAWIMTIARRRNRNEEWAKQSVTKSFSITEEEALEKNIVNLIARDLEELLEKIDGSTVELPRREVTLATANARVTTLTMSKRQQFLAVITNPNVAYLLMMLGTFGLIFEFTHPGIGFPGIAGLICLLLAMYAFQTLPISYVAIALLALGLGLLIAEAMVISYGLLAVGGVIALTLGSLMLFESSDPNIQVSLGVILPTVATITAIILFVVQRALRIQTQRVATGTQGLVGEIGQATTPLKPEGSVFVHGETWSATSKHPVKAKQQIRVVRVEGLRLIVEPLKKGGA